MDLWFSRHDGKLYFVLARKGQEPTTVPRHIKTVAAAYRWALQKNPNIKFNSVGILPPEMIGLDIE